MAIRAADFRKSFHENLLIGKHAVKGFFPVVWLAAILSTSMAYGGVCRGRVVDSATNRGIGAAIVTLGNWVTRTNGVGNFEIEGFGQTLGARAYGYWRNQITASKCEGQKAVIKLKPVQPKGLHLSVFGIGSHLLRGNALQLIRETELNALSIDVKSGHGFVAYRSSIPLAAQVRAQQVITIPDLKGLVTSLHQQGIYLIARIVSFKDNCLGSARPDLAVKMEDGGIWRDQEGMAWVDPFKKEVRDYNIDVAVEAAQAGFDEIQFDYVRFPSAKGVVFSQPSTQASRVDTIDRFLREARQRLIPYNVFLAADIFGYVCWNRNDTGIGQKLENVVPLLDYISPMLYPSGFRFGIPGYRNPIERPYEVVYRTLERAAERTGIRPVRFRPWLQAFRDYAFDRRQFAAEQIRDQIRAAEIFGSDGWMLWNPRNVYSSAGLMPSHVPTCNGRDGTDVAKPSR